ncbi:ferric reductase-like transmembrane domain-containing protein [Ruegeria sp.]|uniref:ferredoxin reductase family protein n=1 Tax=Ruegeria sp. TaxID=1879320 RepID=UPI00230AAEE3|nr:ferric reductase-like transmembrane domain-containing protein [Ruegeria sp.]MDA7964910.1 ferric reductase-like transmembrane domain-containing protein [Ruegeria sp.]
MPNAGKLIIFFVLALFTAAFWIPVSLQGDFGLDDPSVFIGGLAYLSMSLGIFLSARPRFLEPAFGGLDKMYKVHKWLGVAAFILLLAHFATAIGAENDLGDAPGLEELEEDDEDNDGLIGALGLFSMIGFVILTILTLNRKFPYHRWLPTHRLMGLFYALVSFHMWLVLSGGEVLPMTSPAGMILLVAMVVGLASFIYKQVIYPLLHRHGYEIAEIRVLDRITELVLSPVANAVQFRPGQFAFVTVRAKGFKETHPFTIASGAEESHLKVSVKVLGDFTRRLQNGLQPGTQVSIDGPYGCFNPTAVLGHQVWIAGGIGVTPFLSALRSLPTDRSGSIRFYYCVRHLEDAVYLDELQQLARQHPDIEIKPVVSGFGDRMSIDRLKEDLDHPLPDWNYFFCGPSGLGQSLFAKLREAGVSKAQLHREEFEMR